MDDSGIIGIIIFLTFLIFTLIAKIYFAIKDEKRRKNDGEE